MCDLADGFRLCTCNPEELVDPDWHLERLDESLPEQHRRGRVMIPRYDERDRELQARIIAALDDGSCFDFDYVPRLHDVLRLRVGDRHYRFRYEKKGLFRTKGWALDHSNALVGWRAQMVPERAGTLDSGDDAQSPSSSR